MTCSPSTARRWPDAAMAMAAAAGDGGRAGQWPLPPRTPPPPPPLCGGVCVCVCGPPPHHHHTYFLTALIFMRLAGSQDMAYWGGSYDSSGANTYTTMHIGGRRILMIGLEFFPRSEVLNWARNIHDAHPYHECWITTHSYLSDQANSSMDPDTPSNRVSRGTGGSNTWQWPLPPPLGNGSLTATTPRR